MINLIKIKKILFLLLVVFIFVLLNYNSAFGLTDPRANFILKYSPINPGPYEKVEVNLISYSFDIDRSNITWVLNGKTKLKGIGEKDFSFFTDDVGSKTSLSVTVVNPGGQSKTETVNFRPADLDILWEAETYVPQGYKGKSLSILKSTIKVTAMPNFVYNGSKISPSKLVYDWEINNKVKTSVSGYGKQSFSYTTSIFEKVDIISVTVSSFEESVVAEKTIGIEKVSQKIVFYEEHPLEGRRYNKALDKETNVLGETIDIVAEPYFFPKDSLFNLTYEWLMNNRIKIEPEEKNNMVSLSIDPDNPSGFSNISVNIRNQLEPMQFGKNSIKIKYGQDQ